ncbi:MAG: hypothetical protein NTX53_02495 [candidate division WOR-3 bacterium]|nr:hypothetical protein [candidate division WOR-3 bacterium]
MKSSHTNRRSRTAGLLLVLLAMATTGLVWARSATPPPPGRRLYDKEWLNINKWKCPFYNDGRYGYDNSVANGVAGGAWPQPLHNCYIFGAGLWFGSLKPRAGDPEKVDTLVTFGYNPNSGGTEMSPVTVEHVEDGSGSPDDRIFVYPADWPPAPRNRWVTAPELDSIVPKENFSLMDMWCAYSDVMPENHISPGKPQFIDVYQTVYAWNYPSNQDIFFIIYHVRNAGTDTLKKCFMGAVCDADVGDATDDMVGLLLNKYVPGADTVRNVGFVGDNNNQENTGRDWESGTPGVFAYKFLESPRDTAGPTGKPLGMTAFKKFTIDIDPVTDAAQYLTMAGFDYRTGVYAPYDSVDAAPADKRFVQCSGPFTLAPGQMERLVIACIGAPYGAAGQNWQDRPIEALVPLAKVANQAQFIYDQGWLLPGPPLSPNMTLVPGDNQVRIVWDNLPETTADPYWLKVASDTTKPGWDPMYKGYDFQGYVVYKSVNGSDWGILAQCDLADSITFNYPPGGDSAGTPDSLWLKATDAGLFYSLCDSNVTNGFTYYYCVTAYDWNYQTTMWLSSPQHRTPLQWDTLILRSGLVSNFSTVPRWDAANYVSPTTNVVTAVGDTTQPGMKWMANVVVPAQVTADMYELRFLEPGYGGVATKSVYRYVLTDLRNDSVAIETTSFSYTVGNRLARALPVFNGLALSCSLHLAVPTQAFDSAYVIHAGQYPAESVGARPGSAPLTGWAFRGSDYKIVWTAASGHMTAKVLDVTHGGVEVPLTRWTENVMPSSKANGWCFVSKSFKSPSDTLTGQAANIYICGGYVQFKPSGDSLRTLLSAITDGDTWYVTGHKAEGTAPFYNVYHAVSTPGMSRTDTTYKLNVKVVPNPYIVFNSWEKTSAQRNVKFTHLPSECTIRIFTLAGDLVKVIKHKDTQTRPLDQGGTETWDFTNESPGSTGTAISGQLIASGVYIYHVQSPVGEATGKLVFIY